MAVSLTITVSDADAGRVAEACGVKLGLRNAQGTQRNATVAEVRGDIGVYITGYVNAYEAEKAAALARAGVTDIGTS